MSYKACPNYLEPFDGWIVIDDDERHPRWLKKFTGPRAQIDAQTLAFLLGCKKEKPHEPE